MSPLISIIIPVYNAEKTIAKCLTSILNQTFTNYEILLMNDGSTDGSLQVLREYEALYPFIRVIDKPNEGVAKTRNQAIILAQGEFVMFIDNDDYVDKDYVETLYNAIKDNNLDIVIGGYRRVTHSGRVIYSEVLRNLEWAKYVILSPWAKLYRKSFLIEHQITFFDYAIGEDVVFNLKAYAKTSRIKTIDYIGYNWLDNKESVSNTSQVGLNSSIDLTLVMEEVYNCYQGQLDKYVAYFLKRYYIWYLLYSGRVSNPDEFVAHHQRYKSFLEDRNILVNLYPLSPSLFAEKITKRSLLVKCAVAVFSIAERLNMVPLFAKLYCKG